jgi:ankyrin repeat protein
MSAAQIDELHARLRANDVVGAEQLLASGIPINSVVDENFTPLMTACLEGHVESVEMLLRQLPSPAVNLQNKVRSRGTRRLTLPYNFSLPDITHRLYFITILASAGQAGHTALMCAVDRNRIDIVKTLLTHVSETGETPLLEIKAKVRSFCRDNVLPKILRRFQH